MSDVKKKVDSDWKKKAEEEKAKLEAQQEQARAAAQEAEAPLPPPTFAHFLAGLELQARFAMGEIKDPESKEAPTADLPTAQYVIDTIAMLQEKVKGNLSTDEDIQLQNLLTRLRFSFVEAKKAAAAKG